MNCKNIHKAMVPYIENELDKNLRGEFEEHIKSCDDCRLFLEEFQKTFSIIETEKVTETNPFFYTALKAKMENRATKTTGVFNFLLSKYLQPALFSVLLIAGIYFGLNIGEKSYYSSVTRGDEMQELSMYLNEMSSEPIETFLMD